LDVAQFLQVLPAIGIHARQFQQRNQAVLPALVQDRGVGLEDERVHLQDFFILLLDFLVPLLVVLDVRLGQSSNSSVYFASPGRLVIFDRLTSIFTVAVRADPAGMIEICC